jgi:LmbE family N-acetylglucosaminyl deacetylase
MLKTKRLRLNNRPGLLAILIFFSLAVSFRFALLTRAQETTPTPSAIPAVSPAPIDRSAVEIHQALLDLANPWTVMCVAAHPDDEDGTTLTMLRHKYGVHTVSLFSTYGEGGQNDVGPELYEELGVIRARETMEAARVQGSEPYFLGLKDFGFSKSADETFRVWGHDEALRRMVLKIRELRPDVIITNHDTTSGHGHHQATGRLVLEAFTAAADPQRFPEQLKTAGVWQPKRLFVRASGQAASSKDSEADPGAGKIVTVDPNETDPTRGTIYAAQALEALQHHASQGPWPKTIDQWLRFRGGGARGTPNRFPLIRYRLTLEAPGAGTLPPGGATVLDGLRLPDTESARLSLPAIDGHSLTDSSDQYERIIGVLIAAKKSGGFNANDASDLQRFHRMNQRLDHALAAVGGLTLRVKTNNPVLVLDQLNSFSVTLANNGPHAARVHRLTFAGWGEERPLQVADQLPAGKETTAIASRATPRSATISLPSSEHLYDGRLFGVRFTSSAIVEMEDIRLSLSAECQVEVAPAVEIKSISPSPYVWTPETKSRPLSFQLQIANHLNEAFTGTLTISSPDNRISRSTLDLTLGPNETRDLLLASAAAPSGAGNSGRRSRADSDLVIVSMRRGASEAVITQRMIRLIYADARIPRGLRVGFIPTVDQTLERALDALGVESTKLSAGDIQTGDLKKYHTIVIDNRGYQAHAELIAANGTLLSYVNGGGTLIVFYHKTNEWNPSPDRGRPQLAPYPITLGDDRVTDENAPVKFLRPADPLLNFPNRITAADFADWIQERGLYFPKEWDSHYTALLATNDPGETPLSGGLLATSYGRGHYIYTSMVWYRQLRAGVPGGYRVFANMISYGHR